MKALRIIITLAFVIAGMAGCASQSPSWVVPPQAAAPQPSAVDPQTSPPTTPNPDPWPRRFISGDSTLLVYQPQVEKWEGNQIDFRSAVAVQKAGATGETFGVIWGTARTEVNRAAHMVTLEDLKLTRCNFPTLADGGASYLFHLQQLLRGGSRTIALERLQASLAASGTLRPKSVAVKNDPPQIIVSYSPAILVPVSGKAVWRDVPNSGYERVINTRALILRLNSERTCYLHVYDGWLSANSVEGPYSLASNVPLGIEDVANALVEQKLVDPLKGANAKVQPDLHMVVGTALLWGSYTNYRTGTTGNYSGNRYVNPYEGKAGRSYERSFDTAGGTTGNVSRGETYNAQTGQTQYSSNMSATGKGGSSVTRDTSASWGAQGTSADRQTSVYNANTGQTKTYGSGSEGNDRYASANGENYKNDGSGWQKQTSGGWESAKGEDTSWADREQQSRSQAESKFSSFNKGSGGWASRSGAKIHGRCGQAAQQSGRGPLGAEPSAQPLLFAGRGDGQDPRAGFDEFSAGSAHPFDGGLEFDQPSGLSLHLQLP